MNDNIYDERLREIVQLIGQRAPHDTVLTAATELKRKMINDVNRVYLTLNTLDNLIALFAPEMPWQAGWWSETTTATSGKVPSGAGRPPRYSRTERTLEITRALVAEGARTVKTEDIAGRLRGEGETSSIKDLATAVGNILTRSGSWRRVGPGEYAPEEQEVN